MGDFLNRQLKGDRIIWGVFFFLCVISLIEGYSASSILVARGSSVTREFVSRCIMLAIGVVCMLGILRLNYRRIRMLGYSAWIVAVFLMIVCIARGMAANGEVRWFYIFGFSFQPSELAKFSMVVITADWVARCKSGYIENFENKYFWIYLVMIYTVTLLIMMQNLSTAILLFATCFLVMFCCGISWRKLLKLVSYPCILLAIVMSVVFIVPESHFQDHNLSKVESVFYKVFHRGYTWKARVERKTSDESKYDLSSQNAQIGYSQVAIARGGVFLAPGRSVVRDYLAEAYSDFIYAIIVEELGFVGGIAVALLYFVLLVRVGRVVRNATKIYPIALALGATLIIVIQALIHMAVCVNLIPVTGQPLPIISRGGTACIMCCCYFGLILNVTRYAYENKESSSDLQTPTAPDEEFVVVDEEK